MSLFDSIGASVSSGKEFVRDLPPDDEWVDVYIACDPSPDTETYEGETKPALSWKLKSVKLKRSDGEPFLFFLQTNTNFSENSDKGRLTKLIDALFGRRITREEFKQIKPGELIGKTFRIMPAYYEGFDKFSGKTVTKYKVDRAKGFKPCRVPLLPGQDFTVVPYVPREPIGAAGISGGPPPVSYNERGNAVIAAPSKEKDPRDEWEIEDPFANESEGG